MARIAVPRRGMRIMRGRTRIRITVGRVGYVVGVKSQLYG